MLPQFVKETLLQVAGLLANKSHPEIRTQAATRHFRDTAHLSAVGTADDAYLLALEGALKRAKAEFNPDVILYNAGAPHPQSQGGMHPRCSARLSGFTVFLSLKWAGA